MIVLTGLEALAIKAALQDAPKVCQYHGVEFTKLGMRSDGSPRCESCRVPWRALQAWRAYCAAHDRD